MQLYFSCVKLKVGMFVTSKCMVAHDTGPDHNFFFSVMDSLCEPLKNKGCTVDLG